MKKIIVFLVIVLSLAGCSKKEEKVNDTVLENQIIDNLIFNKAILSHKGDSTLSVEVTNSSDNDLNIKNVTAIIKDKNNKKIIKLVLIDNLIIKSKETKKVVTVSTLDLKKANKLEYIIDKEIIQ